MERLVSLTAHNPGQPGAYWIGPQADLGQRSNLSESTIRDFEKGRRTPGVNNLAAIRAALEAAGVVFVPENGEAPGVRMKKVKTMTERKKLKADDIEARLLVALRKRLGLMQLANVTIAPILGKRELDVGIGRIGPDASLMMLGDAIEDVRKLQQEFDLDQA